MDHHLLNIALIYIISAVSAALVSVFVFKVRFLGSFWGALILALIGSFSGGTIGSMIPVIFNRVLQLFLPSIFLAFIFLYFYRWLSYHREY